ncbi:PAS domain S-box protein [Paucibacter sp. TC2R-5]|uniref:PAS domain S-box protein n=1 Tax=Paucibacter sp. TC2R-5 TaxID=2893555 RepID=UPI0021E4FA02|nr:PAS domain S-box protein [Paucibacter sp. TC2R-5]MCV2360954.1 PAS domain S-box protein [Paucibacter sp. TC2R-5]
MKDQHSQTQASSPIIAEPVPEPGSDAGVLEHSQPLLEQQRRLLHELHVHQLELEMQNEQLRAARQELEESRDRYVELYEFAPIGYLTLDADGLIEQINLFAIKLLGQERKRLLGRSFTHLVIDQDRPRWRELTIRLRNSPQAIESQTNFELGLRRGDGRPLAVSLHCAGPAHGLPGDKLRVAITDISERRQAELALQESEFRFHQVLRSITTVAVQGYRMDGRVSYWSPASERLYGYSAEEALGRHLLDLIIPPEMRDTVAEAIRQMAATGQPIPGGELTLRRKDGSRVAVISSRALMQAEGQEGELFCVDIDISERLAAEEALRRSDQILRSILQATLDGYWHVDRQCRLLDVNQRYCELSGYTREQLLGRPAQDFDILADDAESAARIQRVLDQGSAQFETIHRRRDGSEWPVEVSVTLQDSQDGGFVVFLRDISARHAAAASLRERELFGQAIGENFPGMLIYLDHELVTRYANQQALDWFGFGRVQQTSVQEVLGPERYAQLEPAFRAALAGEPQQFESRRKKSDGEVGCFWTQLVPHRIDGKVCGVFVMATDIGALRASQVRQRLNDAALTSVSDGIRISDADGRMVAVNAAFVAITGYGEAELLGRSGRMLQGPGTDPQTAADIQAAFLSQSEYAGEILNYRKDGTPFWNALTISPVKDEQGQLTHFVGVSRDVTLRRQADAALQSTLKDKEALLKEVHHRVKNNLQVITSLLRLEAGRSAVADTKTVLQAMQGRIRAMAQLHETLYRSGTFAAVDLGAYLGQVATQAFRAQVLDLAGVRLALDMSALPTSMDQAAAFGLLVNELISNSLKHGFAQPHPMGAGEIKLSLQAVDAASSLWRLRLADNGPGLADDFEARRQSSLGLQLVGDLCRQVKGALSISSQPGQGVAFSIDFKAMAPSALVMPP